MINAKEAREQLNKSISDDSGSHLKNIEAAIKKAIANNKSNITYDIPNYNRQEIYSLLTAKLRLLGYKVERNNGYDQRDGYSWDCLEISW